ncbi:MAG: hypothetical protein MZV49_15290 [Rhodopseudomonas palustris]|nr:hypothetical protein [Rhodopseudomonas palustris]
MNACRQEIVVEELGNIIEIIAPRTFILVLDIAGIDPMILVVVLCGVCGADVVVVVTDGLAIHMRCREDRIPCHQWVAICHYDDIVLLTPPEYSRVQVRIVDPGVEIRRLTGVIKAGFSQSLR